MIVKCTKHCKDCGPHKVRRVGKVVHAHRALEDGHDDVTPRLRGGSYLEAAKEV